MKSIQTVPLPRIDLRDETFSVNFRPDLKPLRASLQAVGLLQPVLLVEAEGRYRVVCGFRRLWVWRELGREEVLARMVDPSQRDDLELFFLSLQENLTTRGFNTVEKAIALWKLVHHFKVEPSEVIRIHLPLLSLEPNEKILKTYLSLAEMEEETQGFVLEEEVSRSNIRLLSQMRPEDRKGLLSLLVRLKLGENRLRELLTLFMEISRREGVEIGQILGRPEIEAVRCDQELTPHQRTERLKKVLWGLRYPRLKALEEAFEARRKGLRLPDGVSLRPSPYFEAKGLRMELRFESLGEFRRILSALTELAENDAFGELMTFCEDVPLSDRTNLSR
ncbi:MAG: ParB/RepB/Spo0J family partition protein [Desulfobacterota bacterium]|nr:ParB/RepB/Spo0J family partition protein [Thermodesulfobacteriota bacterium]